MKVVVTNEHRFYRTPDGAIWTQGINSYEFWTRYLSAFNGVKVVARVESVAAADPAWRRADGPSVEFMRVPNYLGPWQYVAAARNVRRAVRNAVGDDDAVIMRVSSHLAGLLEPKLAREGRPYGLEVVNDPYDVFAPGAVRYRLRPLFRWWFTRQLQRQCARAVGVAYVTESALQRRYPNLAYSVGMSDVEISQENILPRPSSPRTTPAWSWLEEDAVDTHRSACGKRRQFRLVTVASLAQMYKAPDVQIRAVAQCVAAGFEVALHIVGDGKHRPEMEQLAARLGVADRVVFHGQLPAVRQSGRNSTWPIFFCCPREQKDCRAPWWRRWRGRFPASARPSAGFPNCCPPKTLCGREMWMPSHAKFRKYSARRSG